MTHPILELHHVQVAAAGRTILEVGHFTVGYGESLALIGPNGAGKTTLLHVAALLRQPDTGAVLVNGQPATPANARTLRRSISVVFQDSLLFSVSVLTNAAAGLRFQGTARVEAEGRARDWLRQFGVVHLERRHARDLSGGEASRVALARAFATAPRLLLLDEPFASLDAPTRATLLPELRRHLQETGTAAVMVSHDLEETFSFTDRLAVMEHGQILASGNAASLMARPPSRRVAELLAVDNILPATVLAAATPQRLLVATATGQRIMAQVSPDTEFNPGCHVAISFPATGASILSPSGTAPAGWSSITGVISARTPQRHGWMVSVAIPETIKVLVPWSSSERDIAIGEMAIVALPPDAVAVMAA